MTQSKPAAAKTSGLPLPGNAIVLVGMTVVASALGVAFAYQLGMPASAAITCAGVLYVAFVVSHIAVVRGRKVGELEAEVSKLWSALGEAGQRPAEKITRTAAKDSKPVAPAPAPASPFARALTRSTPADSEMAAAPQAAQPIGRLANAVRGAQSTKTAAAGAVAVAATAAVAAPRGSEEVLTLEDETAMARAMAEPDDADAPPLAASNAAPVSPTLAAAARTLDATTIHEMVKKLATETAAAAPAPASPQARTVEQPAPERAVADLAEEAPSVPVDGDAITESVRALRAAAEAMRPAADAGGELPYELDEPVSDTGEAAAAAREERLGLLAEALSADRMDVMLEPILGLKDQATRHYEISVCLRTPDGGVLDPNDDRRSLGGTGILPLIDLAKLSRIAEVSRRLAERGKTGSVFAGFAGESLADDDFLNRFADVYQDRASITEQLVVALAQEDVRAFAPAHWTMVKDLSAAGFRFALEHVTDLDMDCDALKAANIQYVKLDAEVCLRGLPAGHDVTIPAPDVYKFLADKGLSLIIDHIASESQLMRIVDCGALYGQGRLFGGPRPVKAQVFSPRAA